VPAAGALPDNRLVGVAAGGVAAVFAAVVVAATSSCLRGLRKRRLARAIASLALGLLVVWVHGFGAASASRLRLALFAELVDAEWRWAQDAEIPDDPQARVLFLSGADFTTNANLVWIRRLAGHPLPLSIWRLSPYRLAHQITRVADNQLEVLVHEGFTAPVSGSLYRAASQPLVPGTEIQLAGMRVEVLEASGGEPARMRFVFERSLDDPAYVFLNATPTGLKRIAIPPVGGRLRLAPAAVPPLRVDSPP
jgi:hypothetical protein